MPINTYAAKQQGLVDDIVRELYKESRRDVDYMVRLKAFAVDLFSDMCGRQTNFRTSPSAIAVVRLVNRPILDFIGRDKAQHKYAEIQYLKMEVFKKLSVAIEATILMDYQQHTTQSE